MKVQLFQFSPHIYWHHKLVKVTEPTSTLSRQYSASVTLYNFYDTSYQTKIMHLKPLSQWEVNSGDLELTRCKSTVKAICVGLASSANYPDQWSDATIIRCKLHCERVEPFVSLLGGAAYVAVSCGFRRVLHLCFYKRVYGCQSSVLSNSMVYISASFIFHVSYCYFRICDNDEPGK